MDNSVSKQIAKHFREVYFGGNWTCSNLKDNLTDITWQEAVTQVHSLNTIALLVFHIGYYVDTVLKVLQGEELNASDKLSFDLPTVQSEQDWQHMLNKIWQDAERFARLVEQLPDSKLRDDFHDGKYGNYYRNLLGIIEHTHYHLGQIALVKKMIRNGI